MVRKGFLFDGTLVVMLSSVRMAPPSSIGSFECEEEFDMSGGGKVQRMRRERTFRKGFQEGLTFYGRKQGTL